MARRDLLPGVTTDSYPPAVLIDSRRTILRARRRAAAYDTGQILLLAGIDWLFVRWPYAHIPFVGRSDSLLVVAGFNALLLTHAIVARMFPRWSARRIAATWCIAERARFFAERGREQARQ